MRSTFNLESSLIIRLLFKKRKSSSCGVFNGKVRIDTPATSYIGRIAKRYS